MKQKAHILLVEDDPNLGMLLKDYLALKGYEITLEKDGQKGFERFNAESFDVCVLDVMLPKLDGFELATQMLKIDKNTRIIFLTAKSQIEDLQKGFNIGADDYITKPFNSEELLLRIQAILRRKGFVQDKIEENLDVSIGKFLFNPQQQVLSTNKEQIKLTSKETKLLSIFANNLNELVERNLILKTVWQDDSYFNARSMDVYISKLRKYLSTDPSIKIVNVHGEGYKLIVG